MSNRKKTEALALKYIAKITNDKTNVENYTALFSRMSDIEFDDFMVKLRDNKITLSIIAPIDACSGITVENNFKIAKELGFEFFQHLNFSASDSLPAFRTPNKAIVYILNIKRAAQTVAKKISIPEDSTVIDVMTGQVTGSSRASKLTMPELQILIGLGLNDSIVELMKSRGGDLGEANAMNQLLIRDGKVSQSVLRGYATGVESTDTLRSYLNAMHIKTTL